MRFQSRVLFNNEIKYRSNSTTRLPITKATERKKERKKDVSFLLILGINDGNMFSFYLFVEQRKKGNLIPILS